MTLLLIEPSVEFAEESAVCRVSVLFWDVSDVGMLTEYGSPSFMNSISYSLRLYIGWLFISTRLVHSGPE